MTELQNDSSSRGRCWDLALNAFGYGWIFEQKAKKLRLKVNLLTYSGLVLPLAVGGVAAAIELSSPYLRMIISFAGILGVGQLIISAWAIVDSWSEKLAYAQESMSGNYRLSRRLESLGRHPPDDLDVELRVLEAQATERQDADLRQGVSEEEKRMGMRAGLRQYRRECAGCDQTPTSMASSDCDVCGNF